MSSQVRLIQHNDPIDRCGFGEELLVCVSERFTAVKYQQYEVRNPSSLITARNALGLNDVDRFAPASRIDEANCDAADVHVLGYEIARRAWNWCHDRTRR